MSISKKQLNIFYKLSLLSLQYKLPISIVAESDANDYINIAWIKKGFMMETTVYHEDQLTFSFAGKHYDRTQVAIYDSIDSCESLFEDIFAKRIESLGIL